MKTLPISLLLLFAIAFHSNATCQETLFESKFAYAPAKADNPLKGLVPYAGEHEDRFPHSMEFNYVPLSELVVGEDQYDWTALEALLNQIASRGHQAVIRIWMEYPGHDDGIPKYLEDQGVRVVEWLNTNTQPFPTKKSRSVDYTDQRVQKMLSHFIAEFGKKYDGDPRLGFITAGLLGTWGEWHTYPRSELMASKEVQSQVMTAYESAFSTTPVLLRYPAGEQSYQYADNQARRLGYHDDSFAWATLDTGKQEDDWFFVPALKAAGAGAINKWKTSPIGGEIRPEVWGQIFDSKPNHENAQDFATCVQQTHATWLMDTGMFQKKQSAERIANATKQVQRMGYEFYVTGAAATQTPAAITTTLSVVNRGVAPFYYPWKLELGAFGDDDQPQKTWDTEWSLLHLLPDQPERQWTHTIDRKELPPGSTFLAIRVVNPMPGGMPLQFANDATMQRKNGWLTIGKL
jgi:Domain of unknown function (DUF4832)